MPTELSGVDQLTTTTTWRPTPTTTTATSLPKQGGAPQQEPEHLPCPRCDSTNTKFCYYNNYNSSQPRHFCKSCRRYWTHGGTLRDIPVGGGTRKNAKRSRTSTTTAAAAAASFMGPITASNIDNIPLPATPVLLPLTANQGLSMHFGGGGGPGGGGGDGKGNGGGGGGAAVSMGGSFTSLLNTQGPTGILALQGFGLGLGPALEEYAGAGILARQGVWPFPPLGDGGAGVGGSGVVAVTAGLVNNTWQFESGGENVFGGGDCFPWPDLAISTPGNGLK